MPFGKWDKEKDGKKLEGKDKPIEHGPVEYIGGHKAYPEPGWTEIYFYKDRIEIDKYKLKIFYNQIEDITSSQEKKSDFGMALAIGIPGLAWKDKHIYTVIEYFDGIDNQKIVLDFFNNANFAQGFIYKKMLEARKDKSEKGNTD